MLDFLRVRTWLRAASVIPKAAIVEEIATFARLEGLEGHAQAARIVQEAQTQHAQEVARLHSERSVIEGEVEQLRAFEREYRLSLKSFINQQIQGLESTSAPSAPPAGA